MGLRDIRSLRELVRATGTAPDPKDSVNNTGTTAQARIKTPLYAFPGQNGNVRARNHANRDMIRRNLTSL
jgi:hypothetical protein